MTRQWKGTRVAMAVRSANRHRYPILQKPLVIPNETANWRWNEESHGYEQILKKQIANPNETANWRWNEESHQTKEILKKQNFIPN
jgi:hypothetical protein